MSTDIYVELKRYGVRAPIFNVYHEGVLIVDGKQNASFDAARYLSKQGFTGRIRIFDKATGILKGTMLIATAATLTTTEGSNTPLQLKKWKEIQI